MPDLSPQAQKKLDFHLKQVARILYSHTEPEKLESIESIEGEVREQLLNQVAPAIGNFFAQKEKPAPAANSGGYKVASENLPSVKNKGKFLA